MQSYTEKPVAIIKLKKMKRKKGRKKEKRSTKASKQLTGLPPKDAASVTEFFGSHWSLTLQGLSRLSMVNNYGLRTIRPGSLSSKVPAVSPAEAATPSQAGAIMPQQLLITLATEASAWVKLNHPRKTKEGVSLWEDVTKMFEGGGESRQSWEKGWSLGII